MCVPILGSTAFKNMFGCEIRRKSPLRSEILFASSEVMRRPRSDSLLHLENIAICTQKHNSSIRRLLPAAMSERWPQVCRIETTFGLLLNTIEQLGCFHKNEVDEMLCTLDSTEYARLFEPNPTLV